MITLEKGNRLFEVSLKENVQAEWLGLIPMFVESASLNAMMCPEVSFIDSMCAVYSFGKNTMGGEVINGKYCYPEDPKLEPLAIYEVDDVVVYQFDYGIIAVTQDGKTEIIRMD